MGPRGGGWMCLGGEATTRVEQSDGVGGGEENGRRYVVQRSSCEGERPQRVGGGRCSTAVVRLSCVNAAPSTASTGEPHSRGAGCVRRLLRSYRVGVEGGRGAGREVAPEGNARSHRHVTAARSCQHADTAAFAGAVLMGCVRSRGEVGVFTGGLCACRLVPRAEGGGGSDGEGMEVDWGGGGRTRQPQRAS